MLRLTLEHRAGINRVPLSDSALSTRRTRDIPVQVFANFNFGLTDQWHRYLSDSFEVANNIEAR